MGNYTNEKSLAVVHDNFLTRIKNFFSKAIFNRRAKFKEIETEEIDSEENDFEIFELQRPEQKERRLYNFDADNNDDWPESGNINDDEKNINNLDNENDEVDEQTLKEYYEKEEEYSEAYREKQELEQKLMNYYESIKKRNMSNEEQVLKHENSRPNVILRRFLTMKYILHIIQKYILYNMHHMQYVFHCQKASEYYIWS